MKIVAKGETVYECHRQSPWSRSVRRKLFSRFLPKSGVSLPIRARALVFGSHVFASSSDACAVSNEDKGDRCE